MAYSARDAAVLEREYQDRRPRETMPWDSRKQQAWGHTKTGLAALGGLAKAREWDHATDFNRLPNRAGGKPRANKSTKHLGPPRRPRGQTTGPGDIKRHP